MRRGVVLRRAVDSASFRHKKVFPQHGRLQSHAAGLRVERAVVAAKTGDFGGFVFGHVKFRIVFSVPSYHRRLALVSFDVNQSAAPGRASH